MYKTHFGKSSHIWLCTFIYTFIFITCFTGPSALTVNIMKNIKNLAIVVQWDAVDDFLTTTYVVTWTSESDPSNIQSATLIEQSSYTITGLTLDTVYTITVTAVNRCGVGPEFVTRVSLSSDTTSTTSSISPTVTTNTNPMTIISTVNTSSVTITTQSSIVTTTTAMINPSAAATTSAINITSLGATVATTEATTTAIKNNLCTYVCKGIK